MEPPHATVVTCKPDEKHILSQLHSIQARPGPIGRSAKHRRGLAMMAQRLHLPNKIEVGLSVRSVIPKWKHVPRGVHVLARWIRQCIFGLNYML